MIDPKYDKAPRPDDPRAHEVFGSDCRWHVTVPNRGWVYHYTTLREALKMLWHLSWRERNWLLDPAYISHVPEPHRFVPYEESDDNAW